MSECNSDKEIYYQKNRDVILNRAKNCHENENRRLREQVGDKYRNLSERWNAKIWKKQISFIIFLKKKKQWLKEYKKKLP